MLIAAYLRAHRARRRASCGAAYTTAHMRARRRGAVGSIGRDAIAIVDVQLHLLAALAFERHDRLRLGGGCRAEQKQQAAPRERTHGVSPKEKIP
ncbi:hypothetical protein D3C71_1958740 [compost metagenome]